MRFNRTRAPARRCMMRQAIGRERAAVPLRLKRTTIGDGAVAYVIGWREETIR